MLQRLQLRLGFLHQLICARSRSAQSFVLRQVGVGRRSCVRLRRLGQLLLFCTGEVKCQPDNLRSHAPVIGNETQVSRLRCNVLLLLSLAVPVDGLTQELHDL